MKNSLKKIFICMAIAAVFIVPLQLSAYSKSNFNKNISSATKTPVSKKQTAYKFIMAMIGVATSSIVIYVGLSAYNKWFRNDFSMNNLTAYTSSPNSLKTAVESFLEKTDWD